MHCAPQLPPEHVAVADRQARGDRAEERADCPFVDLPSKQNGQWVLGITPSMMKKMHWITPKFVAEIKFAEWTRDGKLRSPVFVGLREDKNSREVVRETTRE